MLSFAAIVQGRDSSVRVTEDGLGDVIDVVMAVTGKNCNHANEVLRNLKQSLFDTEIFVVRNGRRYASLRDIITLIMVLPGKMAKELRSQFAEIIENYIKNNIFFAGANSSDDSSTNGLGFKRKLLELLMQEEEVLAKRVNRLQREEEIKKSAQARVIDERTQNQQLAITAYAEIERIRDPSKPTNTDERTRLMMQDFLQNSILNSMQVVQFTGGQAANKAEVSQNKPISISSVAKELGYKASTNDSKRIGSDLSKRYFKLHGKPPSKHDQLIDGRVTSVNSYTEQDRPLVEQALRAYFLPDVSDAGSDWILCEARACF